MNTSLSTTSSEERKDPLAFIKSPSAESLQSALAEGNLAKLSTEQRLQFLAAVCESVGLNPLTQPFEFITFQGKIRLYVKRDATDQLRKMHEVSIAITGRQQVGDILTVTARATMPNGRCDESIGALSTKGMSGDVLAIALMKAETKAKRRVTLSICGLGFMDESEVETAQGAEEQEQRQQAYGGNTEAPKPQAEGMMEAEVVSNEPAGEQPKHWSDLMVESAYNLVVFPQNTPWPGQQLWQVAKDGNFKQAFEEVPREDTIHRHALDARYFANLKKRLTDKGYDLDEATAALRKAGFLDEDADLMSIPGERLLDLGTAIGDLPKLED